MAKPSHLSQEDWNFIVKKNKEWKELQWWCSQYSIKKNQGADNKLKDIISGLKK